MVLPLLSTFYLVSSPSASTTHTPDPRKILHSAAPTCRCEWQDGFQKKAIGQQPAISSQQPHVVFPWCYIIVTMYFLHWNAVVVPVVGHASVFLVFNGTLEWF